MNVQMFSQSQMFFIKNKIKFCLKVAAGIIGGINAFIWIAIFLFGRFIAGGKSSPDDFSSEWLRWNLHHWVIALIWLGFGIYALVKFYKYAVKAEKMNAKNS
jgi:hypothetical protein